ncbi:MAG: hypothetical protein FE78DRAFT_29169 [Acidomyces sp. 'richmondensis']|uniref:CRISPR system Cms protein Csm4 n=1 Tax=Sulfobacillus thermosulfidooxidans TaxID=28034 RepID=A0A2T2WTA3_SULTH|nr:MAG: hypothetical protein FE78DRAFT_29169 [Acidomyces sp. 'richmondensis']PSR25432.1 MAG: hypothetical protein C7B47_12315 [Sulfobacillus thermosulfidooxidans]
MGHLAWAYRDCYGDRAMDAWLAQFIEGHPPFVVSDAWPSGTLPRPVGFPARARHASGHDKVAIITAFHQRKQFKRQRLIAAVDFWRFVAGETMGEDFHRLDEPQNINTLHTGVNRQTGGALEGSFFAREGQWQPDSVQIYVWTQDRALTELLARVVTYQGIGGEISRGYGQVEWGGWEPWTMPPVAHPTAEIWLGHGVPAPNDPPGLAYRLHTKYGRVWGAQYASPWKAPILQVQPGAVWPLRRPWKGWTGRVVTAVALAPQVVDFGLTVTVPVCLGNIGEEDRT